MSAPPENRPESEQGSGAHQGREQIDLPSDAELAQMSTDDLVRLGNRLDDIEVVTSRERFPVPGTRAEKRAERQVAGWFIAAAVFGVLFVVAFIAWPWEYRAPTEPGAVAYSLYTPIIGFTFGMAVTALGMGIIVYSKKLLPEDLAIQQRHDGPSSELDRRTAAARFVQTGQQSGLSRRTAIVRSLGAAGGVVGLGAVVAAFGGLINNPWKEGDESPLLHTEWRATDGQRVYLRRHTGENKKVVLVRAGDLAPGSMETVFPFRESDRADEERLDEIMRSADSPVMLIHLRANVAVINAAGQEDFNYGALYAYSKICTHMGCPTSLYEDQTMRILCPCHQSQFQANEYGKPIFGPATRPLPQLPIAADAQGFLYARSDFIEPVGPAFWERRS